MNDLITAKQELESKIKDIDNKIKEIQNKVIYFN